MKHQAGFTLIELLVAIAIVGIIATIAMPAFTEQLAKSRRAEAIATLADLQLRQERWRANHATYGTLDEVAGTTAAAFNGAQPNYNFSVSGNDGTDVLVTATPKNSQAGDRCGNFLLRIDNNNNNAPAGMVDKTTSTGAERCW